MRGQIGGRAKAPISRIPIMPDDLIIRRLAAQGVGANTEVAVAWDTVLFDRYNAFNPLTPTRLRVPRGATFAEAHGFYTNWASAPGTAVFYRISEFRHGVFINSYYNRLSGQSAESARIIGYPELPVVGGVSELEFIVYHNSVVSLTFCQVELRFSGTP